MGGRPLPEGNGSMETIRLYRSEHVWIADYGEDGVFPLPFTRNASPALVMAHVIERNPDAEGAVIFGNSVNWMMEETSCGRMPCPDSA